MSSGKYYDHVCLHAALSCALCCLLEIEVLKVNGICLSGCREEELFKALREFQFNILLNRKVRIPKSTIYNIKAIKIVVQSVKVFKNLIRCSLKCEINVH